MSLTIDGEEYLTILEACDYLGGISRQTLRVHAKSKGFSAYKQAISKNVYYRKSDLDHLRAMQPVDPDEDIDGEGDQGGD